MPTLKPRIEFVYRAVLTAAILFNVVAPTRALANPSSALSLTSNDKSAPVAENNPASSQSPQMADVMANFDQLPISFVPNVGQEDEDGVRFLAQGLGGELFFTPEEVVFSLFNPVAVSTRNPEEGKKIRYDLREASVLRTHFVDANLQPEITTLEELPGVANHLKGKDPSKWFTNVPTYAGIVYHELYPGIELHYEGTNGVLKSSFYVAPGSNPSAILWKYQGADKVEVDASGNLVITLPPPPQGEQNVVLTEFAPVAWQEENGTRLPVTVQYTLDKNEKVSFLLPNGYDPTLPLVIDPELTASTYLGGNKTDQANAITLDADGNIYLTGITSSTNFPTINPFQTNLPSTDVFVTKLDPIARTILYSTYLGGNGAEHAWGIQLDSQGRITLVGETESNDFPTANGFDTSYAGGICDGNPCDDVFVAQLSSTGNTLRYSTYIGESGDDEARGMVIDANDQIYLAGLTNSSNFPAVNAYQGTFGGGTCNTEPCLDGFLAKVDPGLSGTASLLYSTYLGGNKDDKGTAIALDASGQVYVTGYTSSDDFPILTASAYQPTRASSSDIFVSKFDLTLSGSASLLYSTYLGGNESDHAYGIALNGADQVYLTGYTQSTDFPSANNTFGGGVCGTKPCYDAYIAHLDIANNSVIYSTYLGGSNEDKGNGIALDTYGNAYVTGYTKSTDFPLANEIQPLKGGDSCSAPPCADAFIAKVNASGNAMIYSTYLGGDAEDYGNAITVDALGGAYVSGYTFSTNFPTTNGSGIATTTYSDAFVAKIFDPQPATPTPTSTDTPTPTETSTPTSTPTRIPTGVTCTDWRNGDPHGWVQSPWMDPNTQIVWDSNGMYGSASNTGTYQVGAYFQMPTGGPYKIVLTGQNLTNIAVAQGTAAPTGNGPLSSPLTANPDGSYSVTDAYLEIQWSITAPIDLTTAPLFQSFCYSLFNPTATPTPTATIAANYPPVAGFLVMQSPLFVGEPTQFMESSHDPDGTIIAWHWDFGDGSTSDVQNATHTYSATGTYTVTLAVIDNNGGQGQVNVPLPVIENQQGPVSGTLFYTRFGGTPNIKKVDFQYDGATFTLGVPANVATTGGADGIVFAPDGELLVGGQGNQVFKVNPDTGAAMIAFAGNTSSYHIALDPTGTKLWSAGIPGTLAEIPLSPFFADGVAHSLQGNDTAVTSLAFDDNGQGYYTASGSGGNGNFGKINLTTFTTQRILSNLPAAHGMVFDSFTGDLLLFGSTHVTQIDPTTLTIVSDRSFANVTLDQGTSDGQGHVFVASNTGHLLFIDYSQTGLIGDSQNYSSLTYLDAQLDDVAPRSGLGSAQPTATYQQVSTEIDQVKSFSLTGSDPSGLPLSFILLSLPTHGTLNGILPDLTYQPDPGYSGPDHFSFKVNNGTNDSSPAGVDIAVGVPLPPPPTPVPDPYIFDFETGDLSGWAVISGTAFSVDDVTNLKTAQGGNGQPFYQQGYYHLWDYKAGGDPPVGVLRSDTVTLPENCFVGALVAGGSDLANLYVALVRATDGLILFKATGQNSETYHRVVWDASAYAGTDVYIEAVDNASGSWGHINLDDVEFVNAVGIPSMTPTPTPTGPTPTSTSTPTITPTITPTTPPLSEMVIPGWIGSPAQQATVSGVVPITLASGVTLQSGTVDYWPANDLTQVKVLGTVSNKSGGDTLASLDTTALANGSYVIRLQGTDSNGNQQDSGILITVSGEYKPGRVRFTITDLTIPVVGLPITIARTYDSLERNQIGDFGYGWTLDIGNPKLETNPAHDVTITMPDGRRSTFYFTPQNYSGGFGIFKYPHYTPEAGVYGSLTSNGCDLLVLSGGQYYCFLEGDYQPTEYTYTDPYGRKFVMSADGTLKTITDLNNNILTFSLDGITSSAGNVNVPFHRDAQGRIDKITYPAGKEYIYDYKDDAGADTGDLKKVTFPTATLSNGSQQTIILRYNYDNHFFTEAFDPRNPNHPLAITTYDSSGRIESVTDAAGNQITYDYDLATHTTTVHYLGDPTNPNDDLGDAVLIYNEKGNLVSYTDPLSHTTSYEYDPNTQKLTKVIDPLLHATQYTYNPDGHPTSIIDPLGKTLGTVLYNQYGGPKILTTAQGGSATVQYDQVTFMPLSASDNLGSLGSYHWTPQGNPDIYTDQYGQPTNYTYTAQGYVETKTDPLQHVTHYTYNDFGQVTEMKVALGTADEMTTRYKYDELGRQTEVTIAYGTNRAATTKYEYDANGNRTAVVDPLLRRTEYRYDPANRLEFIVYAVGTPLESTTQYKYDFYSRLTDVIAALGKSEESTTHYEYYNNGLKKDVTIAYLTANASTTHYVYYDDGRVQDMTIAYGSVDAATTHYAYDAAGRLTNVTVAPGQPEASTMHYEYYDSGLVRSMTTAYGTNLAATTLYFYDSRGRSTVTQYPDGTTTTQDYDIDPNAAGWVDSITDQAGVTTKYIYDEAGRLDQLINSALNQTLQHITNYDYDAANRLTDTFDPLNHHTSYTYYPTGQMATSTAWLNATTSYTTTYDYNLAGEQISSTDANNHPTQYQYNERGLLKKTIYPPTPGMGEIATSQTYDAAGRLLTSTDENGIVSRNAYNAAGQLISVTLADGTIDATTIQYGYTVAGQLASITDAKSHVTRFEYNDAGQEVKKILPDNTTYEQFGYNAAGNMVSHRLEDGNTNTFRYDKMNRLTDIVYFDGRSTVFQYTDGGQRKKASLYPQPLSVPQVYNYDYDPFQRLKSVTSPDGRVVSYDYYDNDLRHTMTTPAGTITYGYDDLNRLTSVLAGSAETTYQYDPVGFLTDAYLPNGVHTEYTPNERNQLTNVVSKNSSGVTLLSFAYDEMDNAGNRKKVTEVDGSYIRWDYDNLYRLTAETRYNSSDVVTWQAGFTYDDAGNRDSMTVNGGTTTYQYNALDQLTSAGAITYDYDGRGNLNKITNGSEITNYTYNAADQLSNVVLPNNTNITYGYDADGRRVKQTVGSTVTNYLWDEASPYSDVVFEYNGSGATLASYVLDDTGLISQARGGTTNYYLQDGQGSTRALTSGTGAVTDTYSYTAFGELFSQTGSTTNSYLYTGQQFDSLTSLYSLRARYYHPALGRFLSQDTYPVNFSNPIELNRYAYAADSPINLTDPTGKQALAEYSILLGGLAGGAVGGVQAYICGGSVGGIIEGVLLGGIFGVSFAALASVVPLIAAGAGLGLSAVAAESSLLDMLKHGTNSCNRFSLAMSLLGMASGFGGIMGGPPSLQPVLAGANGTNYSLAAQGVGTGSQTLAGLGGISLVSMMSGNGGGTETKIYGKVQRNATPKHNKMMQKMAEKLAGSGDYDEVWMDTRVSISTKREVQSLREPDVLGLNFEDKIAHLIEIPSPSQIYGPGHYTRDFLQTFNWTIRDFKNAGWSVIAEIIEP